MLVTVTLFSAGDAEFKQNKSLPAEKQIVTANPDINTVCNVVDILLTRYYLRFSPLFFFFFLLGEITIWSM